MSDMNVYTIQSRGAKLENQTFKNGLFKYCWIKCNNQGYGAVK